MRSFGVKLHGYDQGEPARLGSANRDLPIVDPDGDGSDCTFDAHAVEWMRGRGAGGHAKFVLAYLSIGEAEPNR